MGAQVLLVTRRTRLGKIPGLLDQQETIMLCLGSAIRLTRREVERFTVVTGIEPVGIRTTDDLRAYVARCKAHYWGMSADTRYLHWLIDREVDRCKGGRRAAS